MSYTKTLQWMFSQLPMYQRQGKTAFKKDLTNSLELSEHLGCPEGTFKSVHVAGTNGKGSTSHIIASVLQEAGYKVGLYTSPHLKDFRERIKINGRMIGKTDVINFIKKNRHFLEKHRLSFFEMTVGLAFDYFARQQIDIAIIEVGLGGRLDSTNIIHPEVSVITNIGMDHTQFLGDTLVDIAFEKAGIIKREVTVVIGEFQEEVFEVFKDVANKKEAPIYLASEIIKGSYKTDLKGNYQAKNVKTAVQVVHILNEKGFDISENQLYNGLNKIVINTCLSGRWQILNKQPKVICDTAHNREGLLYVMNQIREESYDKLHVVLGVVNDKNLETVLPLFPKKATYYFCCPDIPRGMDAMVLQVHAKKFGLTGNCYQNVNGAYDDAMSNASLNDLIFVGGSTFVVAEIL